MYQYPLTPRTRVCVPTQAPLYTSPMRTSEILLSPEEKRFNLFPIRYTRRGNCTRTAFAAFWTVGEVDLSKDPADWSRLTMDERHFVSMVLAFFANSDGIVNDNLAERFGREVCPGGEMLLRLSENHGERAQRNVLSAHSDIHCGRRPSETDSSTPSTISRASKKRRNGAIRWIDNPSLIAERLVAFAVVEGIFFSGSFCAIFWLKERRLMPGLCNSNTLIARDEGMHQDFAAHLYKDLLVNKLTDATVHEIVRDAVVHEKEFICDALPVSLIGMNAEEMSTYIEFVADRLLVQLGHPKLFHASCPFEFMLTQGLETKANSLRIARRRIRKAGVRVRPGGPHVWPRRRL